MTTRVIGSEKDRDVLLKLMRSQQIPFTVEIVKGRRRSVEQNRLQRLWTNEIAEQLGDRTPEEARGYCKLTIGVPILRAENELFCLAYDKLIRPRPYEEKLALMMEPIDFPVTRKMTTGQKTRYLDGIVQHFGEQGVVLTQPET
jgi:hypothetical protein